MLRSSREDHGGCIELGDAADKIPGQRGAWMRLRFAAETAAAKDAQPTRQSPSPPLATNASPAMADDILIVDDEADIRELVSGILQDEGFITRSARDSYDALAHV